MAGVEGSGGRGGQLAGGPGGPAHVQALQGGRWQGGRNSPGELEHPAKLDSKAILERFLKQDVFHRV